MSNVIPVLLYHSVPSGYDEDPLAVNDERFIAHMYQVARSGRVALTISQLAAGLRGACPLPERAVAITFDDGHANNLAAVELLLEKGLRASVYLTTGRASSGAVLDPRHLQGLAGDHQAVEIGAHSVTHPRLDELNSEQVHHEVAGSKDQLEQMLGAGVATFAYPHGAYDRWVRKTVIDAGYTSAVAVKNAMSHTEDDPWAIARWTVTKETKAEQIARVLEGDGVPRAWQKERIRTRSYRVLRRARRRLSDARQTDGPTDNAERSLPTRPETGIAPYRQESVR
jgi:peptidoglycan/xylan/chitin deacetylase (PgdA/CDA1 family)